MTNKKRKSITLEQLIEAELNAFVIQIGSEFYNSDGMFVFDYKEANKHYNKLLSKIKLALSNGNEKEKIAALRCLPRLHILPLRIQ